MIYFDSCAFLKLLLPEEHRPAIAKTFPRTSSLGFRASCCSWKCFAC